MCSCASIVDTKSVPQNVCQFDAVDDPRNTRGKFQVEKEPATISESAWSLGRTLDVMLVRRSDRELMEMAYMGDRIGFESICGLKAWSIPGVRARIGPSHDVGLRGRAGELSVQREANVAVTRRIMMMNDKKAE